MSWFNIDAWWILQKISLKAAGICDFHLLEDCSLWVDQTETDMSLHTVQQCFINSNSLSCTYFTCVSGSHFKVPSFNYFFCLRLFLPVWLTNTNQCHNACTVHWATHPSWPLHCPASIVQEAAGRGAAAEDIVSPGHPQSLPWALQSSKLTCPQSWVPTSRRTLHWQICKSNPHKDMLLKLHLASETLTFQELRKNCLMFTLHCNLLWLHWMQNIVSIHHGRPCLNLWKTGYATSADFDLLLCWQLRNVWLKLLVLKDADFWIS